MFDLIKQVIDSKRIHSIDPKGRIVQQQIDKRGVDHLNNLLFASKRIQITKSAKLLIVDMMDTAELIYERMSQLHLPYNDIFFDIPDVKIGLHVKSINRQIEVELFQRFPNIDKLNLRFASFNSTINLIDNNAWFNNNKLDRIYLLFNREFSMNQYSDIRLSYSELFKEANNQIAPATIQNIMAFTNIKQNKSNYFGESGVTDKMIHDFYDLGINELFKKGQFNGLGRDISSIVAATYFVVAALTFLDLHSYIPIKWTHNVRETKGGKRGLSHSIIDIDINAKQYLPKPKEEDKHESGIKHRHHEVRGTWCISRRSGKTGCKEICVPMEIDERRIKCLQCGKKSWHRKNHERGDDSLGTITKEYKVIVS